MTELFEPEVQQLRALYGDDAAALPADLARSMYSEWCVPARVASLFVLWPFAQTPAVIKLVQRFCAYIQVVPAECFANLDFMDEHLALIQLGSDNISGGHPLVELSYSGHKGNDTLQTYESLSEFVVQGATYLKSVLAQVTPKYASNIEQNKARDNIVTLGWAMQGAIWALIKDAVILPQDLTASEAQTWQAARESAEQLIADLDRELMPYEFAVRKAH